MRWFREFFRPTEQCARVGHRRRRVFREGYMDTEHYWQGVASRVRQEREHCPRCCLTLVDWTTVSRKSIDSLSGPTGMWDAISSGQGYWVKFGSIPPAEEA